MSKIYSFGESVLSNQRKVLSLILTITIFLSPHTGFARKIHNRQYRFKITLPATMIPVRPLNDTLQSETYSDSVVGITLMISGRESKFHNVDEYINCSWKELESLLKNFAEDTSLRLISCSSAKKKVVLDFIVNSPNYGCQDNIIYFIHRRKKDIQYSFTGGRQFTSNEQEYVKNIMHTLKLK